MMLLADALGGGLACDVVKVTKSDAPIEIVGGARSVSKSEMNRLKGRYKLSKLVMEDTEDGNRIAFGDGENLQVTGDTGKKVVFEAVNTSIALNNEKCLLTVDEANSCHFRWDFSSTNDAINKSSFRLGRFKIQGQETTLGCFKLDGQVVAPSSLIPLNRINYRRESSSIVLEAYEGSLRETLYYDRVK